MIISTSHCWLLASGGFAPDPHQVLPLDPAVRLPRFGFTLLNF